VKSRNRKSSESPEIPAEKKEYECSMHGVVAAVRENLYPGAAGSRWWQCRAVCKQNERKSAGMRPMPPRCRDLQVVQTHPRCRRNERERERRVSEQRREDSSERHPERERAREAVHPESQCAVQCRKPRQNSSHFSKE